MKRTCALGLVVVGLWVTGGRIDAEETPPEDVTPAEQVAPAEVAPPEPAPMEVEPVEDAPAEVARPTGTFGAPVVLFGELLFLKPTLDDTYFAVNSPAAAPPGPSLVGPSGQRVNDDFDFEPAFRIGAGYEFAESGRTVDLSYTRLDADASESVTGNFLWATRGSPDFVARFGADAGGYPGSASADIDAEYQRIDLHMTQPWELAGLDVGLELGFEWADFRVGEDYRYADTSTGFVGSVAAASRTWGIGPEVGLGIDYEIGEPWDIPGAFSLRAGSSIGLLLSETNTDAREVFISAPIFSVRDEETSRVLTVIHARVGVGYEISVADRIAATMGVGYQIDTYLRGLTRIGLADDIGQSLATTDYYDFDLQGVYASFGVVF